MTSFDAQLGGIFGGKKKFTSNDLQKVLDMIRNAYHVEDSSIVREKNQFKALIWNRIDSQSNDHILLATAAIISAIVKTGKVLELDDPGKVQTFLIRLHQIYEKKTTTTDHKILILNLVSSLTINISDTTTSKSISPIFSILIFKELGLNSIDPSLKEEYQLDALYTQETNKIAGLTAKEKNHILSLSSWLSGLIQELIRLELGESGSVSLALAIISLINVVLSQSSTRKFTKTLVDKSNLLFHLRSTLIRDPKLLLAIDTLEYFLKFPVNEFSGELRTAEELKKSQSLKLESFQSVLFQHFKVKLGGLIFCSSSKLHDIEFVSSELQKLDDGELDFLLQLIQQQNTTSLATKSLKVSFVIYYLQRVLDLFTQSLKWKLLPTFEQLETIDGSYIDVLPSLSSMNLSINDLLLRSYQSWRIETFSQLSQHLQRTIARFEKKKNQSKLNGKSRHAVKIQNFKAESSKGLIKIDLTQQDETIVREWNEISSDDIIFIASISHRVNSKQPLTKLGVISLEAVKINYVLNNNGSPKTSSKSKSFVIEVALENVTSYESGDLLLVKIPSVNAHALKNLEKLIGFVNYGLADSIPDWLSTIFLSYKLSDSPGKSPTRIEESDSKKRKVTSGKVKSERRPENHFDFDDNQLKGFDESISTGLNVINGISGSGKNYLVSKVVNYLTSNHQDEKILLVAKNRETLAGIFKDLDETVSNGTAFNLTDEDDLKSRVSGILSSLGQLLEKVDNIAASLGYDGAYGNDTETALNFFRYDLHAKWIKYLTLVKESNLKEDAIDLFPFKGIEGFKDHDSALDLSKNLEISIQNYINLKKIFDEISRLKPLEYLSTEKDQIEYLIEAEANVIGITSDFDKLKLKNGFQTILFLESNELDIYETLGPLLNFSGESLRRVTLIGDDSITSSEGLFDKLVSRNDSFVSLSSTYGQREIISKSINPSISVISPNELANSGIDRAAQLVKLESEEMENIPGFYQNVSEAEFVIFFYQYLRLIGYPKSNIGILTPFESQKVLLDEVAANKCGDSESFGIPDISTIDNFGGQKKQIIIVSFTRTTEEAKINRKLLNRALSYATSGFYGLLSPSLLEYLQDEQSLSLLLKESNSLRIVPTEKYGTTARNIGEKAKFVKINTTQDLYEQISKLLK